jgi:CRP/FNR family transcriptional regulator
MKFTKKDSCRQCPLKCDIYKAASEMKLTKQLNTLHAEYKKHEVICKQGTEVTHAIYLVKGSTKLFIEGLNHRNIILYILTQHSYIGLLSFFEHVNYAYSVSALEDCHVCMVDLDFVKKLYFRNHDFLIRLNQAFGKSVASIMGKIISLNQKQIRGRVADSLLYLSALHKSSTFNLGITRKELGEMSAISEENAVRILTEFRNEDIIRVNGRQVKINDMRLLKRISEVG